MSSFIFPLNINFEAGRESNRTRNCQGIATQSKTRLMYSRAVTLYRVNGLLQFPLSIFFLHVLEAGVAQQ